MMTHRAIARTLGLAALCGSSLAAGCSAQGYADLGRRLDVVVPIGEENASTWLRATPEGTELFVTGSADEQGEVSSSLVKIRPNTATELITGTLHLDENQSGVFLQHYKYVYPYEPERAVLNREGYHREAMKPAGRLDISLSYDGERLTLGYGEEAFAFWRLEDVVDRIDPSKPEGAADLLRVYDLAILTSQARLLGFGSAGMTQYLDQAVTYAGLLSGHLTVEVRDLLSPKTDIVYHQFQDLSAVILDGLQHTSSDLGATGQMAGRVEFVLKRSPERDGPAWLGTVDYGRVQVENGYAAGGHYGVSLDSGESWQVPFDVLTRLDLSGLAP